MYFKMHSKFNTFAVVCIYLMSLGNTSLQTNGETGSVKKELKITATAHVVEPTKQPQYHNRTKDENSLINFKTKLFPKNIEDIEIPESFKTGFYFFIGLSFVATLFILLKIYRMRLSRAERKYGVHGDNNTQELTPLPMAIEDDSDNEDHTLFDIHRQIRVS